MIWTIIALLALVLFYTFSAKRLYRIELSGSSSFEKRVKEALSLEHIRFDVAEDSNIGFDQNSNIFFYKNQIYHLEWKPEDVQRARDMSGCQSCTLVPIVNGKIDENHLEIFRECARIIKGRATGYFENGWLTLKMGMLKNGRLLFIYDPITRTLERF